MNENLNRLSDRINHLENVVTNLTESLPELARQLGSEIRQGICWRLLFTVGKTVYSCQKSGR